MFVETATKELQAEFFFLETVMNTAVRNNEIRLFLPKKLTSDLLKATTLKQGD